MRESVSGKYVVHDFIIVFFPNSEFHNLKTNCGKFETFSRNLANLKIIVTESKFSASLTKEIKVVVKSFYSKLEKTMLC